MTKAQIRSCTSFFSTIFFAGMLIGSPMTVSSQSTASLFIAHSGINEADRPYLTWLINELQKSKPTTHTLKQLNTRQMTQAQLEESLSRENGCVITIGDVALQKVLSTRQKTPVFSTLVSKTKLDNLIESYGRFEVIIGGIYHEQSFSRQILLSKVINDKVEKLGILLGSNTRFTLPEYRKIAQTQSIDLSFFILRHHASAQQYFERLPIDGGFLLILNDPEHYSSADLQTLLLTSNKRKIAMIGSKYEDSVVAALASVYTPRQKLAKEAAVEVGRLCAGETLQKPKFSEHLAVKVNQEIAGFLGFGVLAERTLEASLRQLERDQSNE